MRHKDEGPCRITTLYTVGTIKFTKKKNVKSGYELNLSRVHVQKERLIRTVNTTLYPRNNSV